MLTDDDMAEDGSLFDAIIPFGKYRGQPLSEADTGYLNWMLKIANGERVDDYPRQ